MGRFRRQLDHVRDAEPGTRFVGVFERSHVRNFALRIALLGVGFLLVVAAAVTFWLPGPNWVLVAAGLVIACGQSHFVARNLDRLELFARRMHDEHWVPYRHKRALLTSLALVGLVAAALLAWYAYRRHWIPFLD